MSKISLARRRQCSSPKIRLNRRIVLSANSGFPQEHLGLLFEKITLAVWAGDDGDQTVYVNPKFCELLGYTRAECMGRSGYDFCTPEGRAIIEEVNAGDRRRGIASSYRCELLTKKGEVIPALLHGTPLEKGGTMSVIEDLREIQEKDEIIRVQQLYFEQLFMNDPDGIVAVDNQHNVLNINPGFTRIFGYKPAEVQGKNINHLIVPPELGDEGEQFGRQTQLGTILDRETMRLHKNGYPVHVRVTGVPIMVEGRRVGIYGIYQDITHRKKAEADLAASKKMLADIMHGSPTATFMINSDHKVVYWNRTMEILTGRSARQMIGTDRHWEVFYDKKRPMIVDYMVNGMRSEDIIHDHYSHTTFKKSRFSKGVVGDVYFGQFYGGGKWLRFKINPLYDPHGKIIGAIESAEDITGQTLVNSALQERVNELRVLYQVNAHILMARPLARVLHDITKDIVLTCARFQNVSCGRITFDGRRYCSLPNEHVRLLYKMEIPIVIRGNRRGKIELGYVRRLPGMEAQPFLPEEKKLLQVVTDTVCRHIASRSILERYEKLVSKIHTGVFIVQSGLIRYANPAFYKMFKVRQHGLLNRPIDDLILHCPLEKIGGLSGYETQGRRLDERIIDIRLTTQFMEYHGKPALLGTIRDITRLKEAERKLKHFNEMLKQKVTEKTRHLELANRRLQSLNDLKDEFIAITSHELRSPLTAVRGYLSLLTEAGTLDQLPEDAQRYLVRANNNIETLSTLVNNILDVSRIEGGRFEIKKSPVGLVALIRRIVDNLAINAQEKNIRICFCSKIEGNDLTVNADPIRLHQVIANMLDNAIKYSAHRKPVCIQLERCDAHVCIHVIDQGIGIPKGQLDAIFDKFMQAKNAAARYKGGAGLGLFIAKNIVELHGGTIAVKSQMKRGTTFTIRLPIS